MNQNTVSSMWKERSAIIGSMDIRTQRNKLKSTLLLCLAGLISCILLYDSGWTRGKNTFIHYLTYKGDNISKTVFHPKQELLSIRRSINNEMTSLRGIDALNNYCNSPSKQTSGDEGTVSEGFKLKMVHIFIRHGDRTSMSHVKHNVVNYNCDFRTWYTGSNTKFRSFPQRMNIFSSGERRKSHFRTWPPYPNLKRCRGSALTSRGALQHLQLGQHLYEAYTRQSHLFEKPLLSQIYVKSTGTLRTYQSAVAFLFGFLPVFNSSNLDIDYSPDFQFCSKKYSVHATCHCPHIRDLSVRSGLFQGKLHGVKNSTRYRKLFEVMQPLFSLNYSSSKWLGGIRRDTLIPAYCHNFKICATYNSSKCVDQNSLGLIWDAATEKEFSNWDDPELNFLKICSIQMTPILREVVERMKEHIENKNTPIFILYSGHDVTISPLLYALGLHDGRWPPYATRVVMELYQNDTEHTIDSFYLRFLYNGVDKTEKVVFCKNRTVNGLCNYKFLREFVSHEMWNMFGYASYNDACLRKKRKKSTKI